MAARLAIGKSVRVYATTASSRVQGFHRFGASERPCLPAVGRTPHCRNHLPKVDSLTPDQAAMSAMDSPVSRRAVAS